MLNESKAEVLARGRSYFEMNANSMTSLASARPAMLAMGEKCSAAEDDFDDAAKAVSEAQSRYEEKHAEYIDKMRETSANHRAFTEAEYDYETAYAVWEYAFTPYLADTTEKEAKAGYGEVEGIDGVLHEDLSTLPVPDAKENYARILGLFTTANEKYLQAKTKMDAQETVESLNADGEYSRLKGRFEAVAKSFTRLARAKDLSDADTKKLKLEVAAAKDEYEAAKKAPNGFNDTEGMSDDEIRERDKILARMARYVGDRGSAGVDAYIDLMLKEYVLRRGIAYLKAHSNNEMDTFYYPQNDHWYRPSEVGTLENLYNNLPAFIRNDMKTLRDMGLNYDAFILEMCSDYHNYREWKDLYEYAKKKAKSNNPITRLRWKNNKKKREKKYKEYRDAYNYRRERFATYLLNVVQTRKTYGALSAELAELDQARDLEYLVSDKSLGRSFYSLEEADLSRLYDNTSKEVPAAGEGVNITLLRKKIARTDLDGFAVRVKKEQYQIRCR